MTMESHQRETAPPGPPAPRAGLLRRKRFLIVSLMVGAALAYLGFTAFQGASTYYLTVNELFARGQAAYGQEVRLMGKVADGSVQKSPETNTIRFTVASDDGASVPVVYSGVVPDAFKQGAEVVVEGSLKESGNFEATTLLVKCPSKYEAEPQGQQQGSTD